MGRPTILSEIKKEIQNAKIGMVLLTDKETASVSLSRLEKRKMFQK